MSTARISSSYPYNNAITILNANRKLHIAKGSLESIIFEINTILCLQLRW